MTDLLETKEAVQYWYKQNDTSYFANELRTALEQLYGKDAATEVELRLDAVFSQFKDFKHGALPTISKPLPSSFDICDLLSRSFFCSAKAYEEHRRGRPSRALQLLRESMEIDLALCEKHEIWPMVAHLHQSRHNVCRLLAAHGRNAHLRSYLAETIELIVTSISSHRPRSRVLLELMGLQVLSYHLGLVEKGKLAPEILANLSSLRERSHLSSNIALFNSIVRKDPRKAVDLLKQRDTFFLAEFKKHISIGTGVSASAAH